MENKILKLGDFKNRSIDDIVDLYRQGYILEGIEQNTEQNNINTLQQEISVWSIASYGLVFTGGLIVGALIMLLARKES